MKQKFTRVVPIVTPTSSFADLTEFLLFSFQKQDGKLVEDILVKREQCLKDELLKLKQENEMRENKLRMELELCRDSNAKIRQERDVMGNNLRVSRESCEELKRERDLCKSKLCWAEMEREKFEEKMRGEFDGRVEVLVEDILVEREKGFRDEMEEVKEEREMMKKNLTMELDILRERYEKLEEKVRREFQGRIEVLEGEKREFQKKNEICNEKLEMVEEFLLNREMELECEVEKRENCEKELKMERDLFENKLLFTKNESLKYVVELKKVFEVRIEVLEGENQELKNKIELSNMSLSKEFAMVEERLAKLKGVFGSVCIVNAEADRGSGNGIYGRAVSMTDSHEKASNLESFPIKFHASPGDPSFKTPRQVESRGSKGITIGVEVKTESSFLEYEAEDGGINCKRKRSHKKSELHLTKSVRGVVDGTDRCSRGDPHEASPENTTAVGFQSGVEVRWKHKGDMLSAFGKAPELCMAAVCALYRHTITAMASKYVEGFSYLDVVSGKATAEYLINNDPEYKLSRSVSEVQKNRPSVLKICQRLAFQYDEQLFKIYQKELDPFFSPKS